MSDGLMSGAAEASAPNGAAAAMNGSAPANGSSAIPSGSNGNPRVAQGSNSGGGFDKDGNWRSFFSDGLDEDTAKDWDSFSSRIQSPAELAKSYVHAQKELRSGNRVKVPGQDAKDEDWDAFYSKVRPESPDKYQFQDPKDIEFTDTDKQYREGFRGVAHRIGLSQRQLSQLEGWQYEQIKLQTDAMNAAAQTTKARTVKSLKSKWGIDFDANLKGANLALAHYAGEAGPELANLRLADGTPLSAHPAFVETFARIHADRAEDGAMPSVFSAEKRQTAMDQIKQIENEMVSQGISPTDKRYPHAKLDQLYLQANPGRSGRRQPFAAA